MGRMNVVSNGLDNKKLDANSSGLSPGWDARTINGTAQSEIILSGHLDYKQAWALDSPRMRATLSTVKARPDANDQTTRFTGWTRDIGQAV